MDGVKLSTRIPQPYANRLALDAERLGMSFHQVGRLWIVEHYEKQELFDIRDHVLEVQDTLNRLRADFDAALE